MRRKRRCIKLNSNLSNGREDQEKDTIREENEARRRMYDRTGGVKPDGRNNPCESDDHDDILREEEHNKYQGKVAIAIIEGVYLRRMSDWRSGGGVEAVDNIPRMIRIDSTPATRSWVPTS